MGFGDEGKGLVTDYLCSLAPDDTEVVRFSGGHQCGHKVVRGAKEHICSNFGSGTLLGCPTHWSKHCTFEPVGFMRERALLMSKGIEPVISVDPDCPVTTPYDILANIHAPEMEHGTTGTGFFRTKKRHYQDGLKLTVGDLHNEAMSDVNRKLDEIRAYHGMPKDFSVEEPFHFAWRSLGECVLLAMRPERERRVFEGSQGLMLDENIGTMPHCTPSDVTPRNALEMAIIDEVWLVSRVYQTRHGNGPMTNEDRPVVLKNTDHETNKHDEFQGEFRTTVLDLDQLMHAKTKGIDAVVPEGTRVNLVMTCADQVERYEFTENRVPFSFRDVDPFVRAVGKALGVNGSLYVNTSPRSSTIRQVTIGGQATAV